MITIRLTTVLLAAASIGLLANALPRSAATPREQTLPATRLPSTLARGIETTIYDRDGAVRAKVSAGTIEITTPRVLGPFRLGIHRRLLARDLAVHVFHQGDSSADPAVSAVAGDLAPLMGRTAGKSIASVDAGPVRIYAHRGTQQTLWLAAARCRAGRGGLECWNGRLSRDEAWTPFRHASYDGRGWKIETRDPNG
jgi:hypothetical protein